MNHYKTLIDAFSTRLESFDMFMHMAELKELLLIWSLNMGVDKDMVVLGISERWATAVATALGLKMLCFRKNSSEPHRADMFSYADGSEKYSLSMVEYELLTTNKRIIIVNESVNHVMKLALDAVNDCDGLIPKARRQVICLPIIEFVSAAHNLKHHIFPLFRFNNDDKTYTLGRGLTRRPEFLGRLRSLPTHVQGLTVVYGPPSMRPHMINYVNKMNRWHTQKRAVIGEQSIAKYNQPKNIVVFYDGRIDEKGQDYLVNDLTDCTMEDVPMEIIVPYGIPTFLQPSRRVTLTTVDTPLVDFRSDKLRHQRLSVLRELFDKYLARDDTLQARDVLVVFPNKALWTRYKDQFTEFTLAFCTEHGAAEIRGMNNPLLDINRDRKSFTAIIVQDVLRSDELTLTAAGTISKMLGEQLKTIISLFVHADLPPGAALPFVETTYVDKFITTNTCHEKSWILKQAAPYSVLVYNFIELSFDDNADPDQPLENFNVFTSPADCVVLGSVCEQHVESLFSVHNENRWTFPLSYAWTFDVPNFLCGEPVGFLEGKEACLAKIRQLEAIDCMEGITKISLGSFALSSNNKLLDKVIGMGSRDSVLVTNTAPGKEYIEPHLIAPELNLPIKRRRIFSKVMEDRYKTAWDRREQYKEVIVTL